MPDYAQTYEKLGLFYLGKAYDLEKKKVRDGVDSLVLYDSKDLVTHAVCVGMTGSGKTGLCLTLLEEAAIDGIPALIIDPKGDLANLLLTFPSLTAEAFRPWINEDEARKKGEEPDAYAEQQAALWKKGLAEWHQTEERIQRLHAAAELAVYTPGSSAGLPLSILKSFDPPDESTREDNEAFKERVAGTVSSLLGLLGIDADPLQSKEHILLSTLLARAWKDGKAMDLAGLIGQIQNPGLNRIGVMELETFYPEKERFTLAMQLNNLLAAPGFESWLEGEPLDIDRLLHGAAGKPRLSIFSIAHLSDQERMFFVSLLLNQVLSWVRSQPGTTSLRAILYMDEIFGYFPPTANPPSKRPLLTLMKQARAFGVGVVLATQNPVDLDYKGLSNAGTWFLGRLQTERDKLRVLEGLEGAAASQSAKFDKKQMEQLLAGLGNRVFLMNNVHEDGPVVFQVRWAMSYLRGPLTRQQIKKLMQPRKPAASPAAQAKEDEAAAPVARLAPLNSAVGSERKLSGTRPVLPPEIAQYFLPVRSAQPKGGQLVYCPRLFAEGRIRFSDSKTGVDEERANRRLAEISEQALSVNWDDSRDSGVEPDELEKQAGEGAQFESLPAAAGKAKNYEAWKKSFAEWLYRNEKLELFRCHELKMTSKPGEGERDFRIRLQLAAREQTDELKEKLRLKYAPKTAALDERLRKAQQRAEQKAQQSRTSTIGNVFSVLGSVFGRKKISPTAVGKVGTTVGRMMKNSGDVGRAEDDVAAVAAKRAELDEQFEAEVTMETAKLDAALQALETLTIKPKKTNIQVTLTTLCWCPCWLVGGQYQEAWR